MLLYYIKAKCDKIFTEVFAMNYYEESLKMHLDNKGKMATCSKVAVNTKDDLSTAYTPGVAQPCREIAEKPETIYDYSNKSNSVAIVTDGSAVLGLGNIGADASLPVMDGKALLFKEFGGIDAYPICIRSQDPDEIVDIAANIATPFGGINIEDICAPKCFYIEEKLQEELDIPVFHDDQHGTAVVVTAALINALKLTGRKKEDSHAVIMGAGAAGIAVAKMIMAFGIGSVTLCNSKGIIATERTDMNDAEMAIAKATGSHTCGTSAEAFKGKDIFIGVSAPNIVTGEMIRSMNPDPIVFPMANPEPEILPTLAYEAGAAVVGTGRSDYPNQINNVLAFPGIFKGALSVRASRITEEMKLAAALAIAGMVSDEELSRDYIMPSPLNKAASQAVADAVAEAWLKR